jgi:large subunit ribosomal protein L13
LRKLKKYTYSARRTDNKENWCIIDAEGKILGRLASQVAHRIRGKHNPMFTPHADTGDWVIVINADKIRMTGNKLNQKNYYRHSGYIGGLKTETAKELLEKKPERIIRAAVRGMLPKNKLGRRLNKKLFVYAGTGAEHKHMAQKPVLVEIQ